jgi:methylated-DNA-protein-cysteine methyltransferase-like protein
MRSGFSRLIGETVRTGEFAERVYTVVASIPEGRVTTYGRIALALGMPRNARRVGWVLSGVVRERGLPCQRVVNHAGYLSGGWAFGHPDVMQAMLLEEGVPFTAEYVVDLRSCVWDPAEELDPEILAAVRGGGAGSAAADEVDDFDLIP